MMLNDYSVHVGESFFSVHCVPNFILSLFQMQTFDIDAPCNSASELCDGVAMSQVLHQM